MSEEVLPLARYLIEDNQDDFVNFDQENQNNCNVITSVFRTLVGPVHLLTDEQQEKLFNEMSGEIT